MIYLAAPLFNDRERRYNAHLKQILACPVYLPQEDGCLLVDLLKSGSSLADAVRTVHSNDIEALNRSVLMVAVLDGPHVDSGVSFEIGYFFGLKKPIVGFSSDVRSELPFGHNPMISGSLTRQVKSESELIVEVRKLLKD